MAYGEIQSPDRALSMGGFLPRLSSLMPGRLEENIVKTQMLAYGNLMTWYVFLQRFSRLEDTCVLQAKTGLVVHVWRCRGHVG